MAIRRAAPSSAKAAASPARHRRLFVPAMLLVLALATVYALVIYHGSDTVLHPVGIERTRVSSSHLHSYVARTIRALKSEEDPARSKVEILFKQAAEQIDLANTYAIYARKAKIEVGKQLTNLTEHANAINALMSQPQIRALQDDPAIVDEEALKMFEKELKDQLKITRQLMADSKELFDNQMKVQKLKDTIFGIEDQLTRVKKYGELSNLIAARSTPKSLHCLSMRLLEERITNEPKYLEDQQRASASEFTDASLYHYVILSDNVLATSVVVNSAILNSHNPEKHVFHIITNKMNMWAMKVWFQMNPPNNVSHIEVTSMDDYAFFKSSYVPLLQQLDADEQYRNLKYRLMLKHLRFYLPELFPSLHRILFLDDDVVVQKDLTSLFSMNMEGKVHAAVEICSASFNKYSHYMNFSHPLIKEKLDPNACAWAYGMNLFDLDAWRKEKCTETYHYWQTQNKDQTLWRIATLPPGLITFYGTTKALDKSWHALGLGSNPNLSMEKIRRAAVIHYNGHMKPWLDIALNQYRDLWTKYVDYNIPFIQMCNIGH